VACLRRLGQGDGQHEVEVRLQGAPQCGRGRAAGGGEGDRVHARARQRARGAFGLLRLHSRGEGSARARVGAVGQQARAQFVQQHAQGVDVGGRGHRFAAQLLGRGVGGRQRLHAERGAAGFVLVCQQLGNAEVQQLDAAVGIHQHIGGLEVAVHDEVAVGVADRLQHLQEQRHARAQRQAARVAPVRDRLALDVLQGEPGPALGIHAAIEQARDAVVRQARQDGAFAAEARAQLRAVAGRANALDRHLLAQLGVIALGQPHHAHAAAPQFAQQAVGAEALGRRLLGRLQREQRRGEGGGAGVERTRRGLCRQQRGDFRAHRGRGRAGVPQQAFAFGR